MLLETSASQGTELTATPSPRRLHRIVAALDRWGERAVHRISGPGGYDGKVRMLAYAGYRNATRLRIKGRIVRYQEPLDAATKWARFRAMVAIYNSRELPDIAVRLVGYGHDVTVRTDGEGYFEFDLAIDVALPPHTEWEAATLTTPEREMQKPSVDVPVLAPGDDHPFGVISDIDDTVIETGATNFVKNWRRVLVEQPGDRLAVPGASTLYRTIAVDHAAPKRPFFYVSSSPWNLYGFLTEFMELNHIPHGPMFLKDYGIDRTKFISTGHAAHKLEAIEGVLAFYPDFRFVLIGDNGQADVAIYAQAVADFPGRVAAVFIRDVDGTCRTGPEGALIAEMEAAGVPTYCGAGLGEAVAAFSALGMDDPQEAAGAVAAS